MSGVFTLGQVRIRQGKDTWSTASDVWMIGSPVLVTESLFGYFASGVRKLTPVDKRIFDPSQSNVINFNKHLGDSFTGPGINKGVIDTKSGTALMDFVKPTKEQFVNRCGNMLCDHSRKIITLSIILLLCCMILYYKYT